MDVNTEEFIYEDSTPIKNSKGNIRENTTNGYVSEDTNCTASSSELFSDNENENENKNDLIYHTPNVSKADTSFLNISETSLLDTNKLFQTSSVEKPAVIPSTPLGLLPFISKINEQWTSDLETPEMNKNFPTKSSEKIEQNNYLKDCTPNNSNIKNIFDECTSTSPVINYTRVRRRTKRRIFKNISSNVNVDNIALNNQGSEENDIVAMDTLDDIEKKNIFLEGNSAQDFFSDASFASVDQICAQFAENNDMHNIKSNNKKRRFEEVSKDNVTVLRENYNVDKDERDEKKILNSNIRITNVTMNNIGFSTASGKQINVSESAISKAKSLLETDDIPSMGFSTASGKQINVSESAILKAKSVLETDDIAPMGFSTASGKHINVSESAILKAKSVLEADDIPSMGFSTASGKQINVSESSISKAKSLLEADDITSLTNIQLNNNSNLRNNHKIKNLSSSFATVDDRSLNICNETLSNTKKMLFEQLDDVQINKNVKNELKEPVESLEDSEDINTNLNESVLKKYKVSKIGFTTAAGRKVIISKEALNKAENVLFDDTSDINQSNNLSNKPINKRKSLNMCDNSTGKLLCTTKKVRLSNTDVIEEKENQKFYDNTETINRSNTFSNEIMASTAALLADEKDNDQTMEWVSQVDNCKKEVPSSPIIGRQPTTRKRGKKRRLQCSMKQNLKLMIKDDTISDINEESVKCNNTSENELISKQEINLKSNIDPPIDNITDILQKRLEAILEQENIIKGKKLDKPKAIKGKLLLYKEENHNNRLSWKKLVRNDVPNLCTPEELIEGIISNNSNGLEMEDGGYLIPDKDNYIGISEIKRSFLASPGVDPNLIPRDWIENHYKWIIWKLASIDRIKFNCIIIPRSLTPANVMLQLKYRYDREIDRLQRPCLRRILEKDDCAFKRMVLCVSSITEAKDDQNKETSQIVSNINYWKIILTDGWYSIPASIDTTMMSYITSGKIREVFRNSRCEEKANLAFEEQCRLKVEAFYAEAEQKFDSARNDNFDSDDIDLNGQEKKMVNRSRVVEEFKQELESKFRENMPAPRQVSSVLKVRINEDNTSAILTIWAPSEDIIDIFKEGTRISIHNVIASGKRSGDLQLTASRNTMFNKEEICKDFPQSRIYTPLWSITDHSFNPLYGEFDTVGIVCSIINCPYGMKNFDAVNIACPLSSYENSQENDTSGSSYLSILFWQGVSTFGYTEILTTGSLVACSNLEWRCATSWNIPIAYCTDRSVFTRNPRHNHLRQAFENIQDLIKISYASYAAKCAEDISLEVQKKTNLRTSSYITPDKNTPDKETLTKNNISISIGSNPRSDTRNSKSIKSAALQRRLEKLYNYNNPPELSPIVLKNASSRVSLDFRSPIRNNSLKNQRNSM